MSDKKLHIVRLRAKDDCSFYDPLADFRGVLPTLVDLALDDMRTTQGQDKADIDYLQTCFRIFQLRLQEDKTPLSEQLRLFREALDKAPERLRARLFQHLSLLMLEFYALMLRRDRQMKDADWDKLVRSAKLLSWKQALPQEKYQELCRLVGQHEDGDETLPVSEESSAVCAETGKRYTHLRELAGHLVNASGVETWDEVAELCDKQFGDDDLSDAENIALALAYPTYKNLSLMVESEESHGEQA